MPQLYSVKCMVVNHVGLHDLIKYVNILLIAFKKDHAINHTEHKPSICFCEIDKSNNKEIRLLFYYRKYDIVILLQTWKSYLSRQIITVYSLCEKNVIKI